MNRKIWIIGIVCLGLSLCGFYKSDAVYADDSNEATKITEEAEDTVEEELSFEEDEVGFAEIEIDIKKTESVSQGESYFNVGGFIKEEIDYSHAYDEPDFSKLRTTLNIKLDMKLNPDWLAKIYWNGFYDYSYEHRGRDEFTDETLETHETEPAPGILLPRIS